MNKKIVPNPLKLSKTKAGGGRLFLYLIWFWMIIIIAPSPVHSFYHTKDESRPSFFQRERNYVEWRENGRAFVFYDNLNHFTIKSPQEPLIYPKSNEFVPADELTLNVPIHVTLHYGASTDESLANMIYADLKLKKLIEDYINLQKRARELLSLPNPSPTQGINFQKVTNENSSLSSRKGQLEREYLDVRRNLRLSPSDQQEKERSHLSDAETLVSTYLRERQQIGKSWVSKSQSETKTEEKGTTVDSLSNSVSEKKIPLVWEEKATLPWIFKAFFDTLKYLMSHLIEVLLYGFFLFILLYFFWSMIPRADK